MNDRAKFQRMMLVLGAAYSREISADMADAYWRALADLSDEQFVRAVHRVLEVERFWPPPAVLRLAVIPVRSLLPEAAAAFEAVEKLGAYTGRGYRWSIETVRSALGDAAAEAFVAAGGEGAWIRNDRREWPFVRKAFLDAYVLHAENEARLALTTPAQRALGNGRRLAPPPHESETPHV